MVAQVHVPTALSDTNLVIRAMTKRVEPAGWLYFKDEAALEPYQLFSDYKADMGLSSFDEMILTKSEEDDQGYTHNRYQQYYKDIKVEGAEYTEHLKNCIVRYAHGKLLEHKIERSVTPTISESTALSNALAELDAETYSWQDPVWEADYQEMMEDTTASSFPEGELVLAYLTQTGVIPANYALAWRFEILSIDPFASNEVYVDAGTGDVVKVASMDIHNGPADLLFGYGEQVIDTRYGFFAHYLRALDDGRNIHTRHGTLNSLQGNFGLASEVTDGDDDWTSALAVHTTAHWVVSQSWDYFKEEHQRDGWDDNHRFIRVLSNSTLPNAAYRRLVNGVEFLEFGEIGGNELCTIDIGGHEFTHGLIVNTSGLGNLNQPGALHESFADIFGFMIERFSFPTNFDWTVGEDAFAGGLRSLQDPGAIAGPALVDRAAIGLPNVFLGPRWYNGQENNGGVHINCGPQNRWFNLLAEGGTENGVDVDGIGIDNAERITYFSLINNIQNQSQYLDAREGAIEAARILFGDCSFEAEQTINAWAAVGVGAVSDQTCLDIFVDDLFFCPEEDYPVVFKAIAPEGVTITWGIPSGWIYTLSGPGNSILTLSDIVPTPGEQAYIVTATSSAGGIDDQVVYTFCEGGPCEPKRGTSKPDIKKPVTEKPASGEVAIFPNPAKNQLSVIRDFQEALTLEIVNITGHVLLTVVPEPGQIELEIGYLPAGMYYLRVSNASGTQMLPFVKQ